MQTQNTITFQHSYRVIDTIHAGDDQRTVLLCQHIASQQLVAVKRITQHTEHESKHTRQQIDTIATTLQQHPHANVVRVSDVLFDDDSQSRKYTTHIVMEAGKCNLRDLLADHAKRSTPFSQDDILDMVQQIAEALLHVKKLGVVHTRVDPRNIIVFEHDNETHQGGSQHQAKQRAYKVTHFAHVKHVSARDAPFDVCCAYTSREFERYLEYVQKVSSDDTQQHTGFVQQGTHGDYEKADVWMIALIALHAALVVTKHDETTHTALQHVPHDKVRALLVDVLCDKDSNESRLGLQELLQRVSAMRQSTCKDVSEVTHLSGEQERAEIDARRDSAQKESASAQSAQDVLEREQSKGAQTNANENHRRAKIEAYLQSVLEQSAQQKQRLKVRKCVKRQQEAKIEDFMERITPTPKYVDLAGHNSAICSLAFSVDSKLLASGGQDKTVKLWNVADQRLIATLQGHENHVWSVKFSPDGKLLASGGSDKTVKLWNVNAQKLVATLQGHQNNVTSVAFSANGKFLASGSFDSTIKVWSVYELKEVATLQDNGSWIKSVAFSTDGKFLFSCNKDREVKFWSVQAWKQVETRQEKGTRVRSVAFSADAKLLASGGGETGRQSLLQLSIWSVDAQREVDSFEENSKAAISVALSPDDKILAVAILRIDAKGEIRLFSVDGLKQLKTLEGHRGISLSLAFSRDGKYMASGGSDKLVRLWGVQ